MPKKPQNESGIEPLSFCLMATLIQLLSECMVASGICALRHSSEGVDLRDTLRRFGECNKKNILFLMWGFWLCIANVRRHYGALHSPLQGLVRCAPLWRRTFAARVAHYATRTAQCGRISEILASCLMTFRASYFRFFLLLLYTTYIRANFCKIHPR